MESAPAKAGAPGVIGPGTRLGPYLLNGKIGAGGMGEVYQASDERLGREVAVKVLTASMREDPIRLRRFEQEARTVGALNHPNIVALYDFEAGDDTPYLVTELLVGQSLRARLGRPVPWREALEWSIQITSGLAAAPDKGIVPPDIKPQDPFLPHDGRGKNPHLRVPRRTP